DKKAANVAGWLPPFSPAQFGDPAFRKTYGLDAAYYTGGMANAIASEEMVITLGKAGLMGSFGSGGLSLERVQKAIATIQAALPDGPYLFNLLHNPFEPEVEQATVELFLNNNVHAVEAAAYIRLTPAVVQYRAAGLSANPSGSINIKNRIIAKISRKEIALLFLRPAPQKMLAELAAEGKITSEQARLAAEIPLADDITVEADSGGHTDNQPLVSLLPSIIALRNKIQQEYHFKHPVRIGAAGGISTPESMLAAYMMGAAYVVTGSINQSCVESGACAHTKKLLSQTAMADVSMAPSADMFEIGARVQVLKKGTFFPMRAQKLYDLYSTYNSISEIPQDIRENLESKVFKRTMEDIWRDTVAFFEQRNPGQIARANQNPKRKMALIFRWYLGLSSRWSRDGVEDRRMDYQIWCGPSMGAFNEWAQGTYLEAPANRRVADIAWQLLNGCAYHYRVESLKMQGVYFPPSLQAYRPSVPK
ncbi:MAG: PfaD family polyunsaturated fatty acid/polyketide biosynthesis protein, partial [Alphaproteobacteria bacterium]